MIVLDAAALVDVLLDQPSRDWVLSRLEAEEICAPAHQPTEVLSAITRLQRAGDLDIDVARDVIAELGGVPQELVPPSPAHLVRAFDLHERIRVTDGLYVALAEERNVPLVTTDLRLLRADPPCVVMAPV